MTLFGDNLYYWYLQTLTIGDDVNDLGDSKFEGCSGLTTVTLPAGLADFDDFYFPNNCSDGFDGLYTLYSANSGNNKAAGTFKYNGNYWTKQP